MRTALRYRIAFAAVAAGLLLTALPAGAGPVLNDFILKWQNDAKVDCKDMGGTTYEMNVCAGRDYQKAYKTMAALYGKLHAAYDKDNKKALQDSQVAWEAYRTAECGYETAPTIGGTIHSTMVTNCDTGLTLARIKQLKAQAACEEGDMGCNHP